MAEPIKREITPEWNSIGGQLTAGALKVLLESDAAKALGTNAAEILAQFLGALFKLMGPIGTGFAQGIADAEDDAAPILSQIAAAAASDLFGRPVPASAFKRRGAGGVSRDAGVALGAGFLDAIKQQAGSVEPSEEPAARFLGMIINLALEGWYQGFTFEFLSSLVPYFDVGKLESFAELDDTLAQSLGLGRLSRRVLGPYIDALVTSPLEWQVNKTYRPRLLGAGEAVRQHVRGRWTREQLDEELARQGFSPDRIEALVNAAAKFHSVADVELLVRAGAWSKDQAVQHLRDQGFEQSVAENELQIPRLQRIAAFERQLAGEAVRAFAERLIDRGQLDDYLDGVTIDRQEQNQIREIAEARRALNVTRLTPAQVVAAVKDGILNVRDYRATLEREGYPPEDVTVLELLLRADLARRRVDDELRKQQDQERAAEKAEREKDRAAREAELAAKRARTLPTAGQVKEAVVRGVLPVDAYRAFLVEQKFGAGDVGFLVEIAEQDRDARVEAERQREAAAARAADQDVALGTLEQLVVREILTVDDYAQRLEGLGFDVGERQLLVALVQDKIALAREARSTREAAGEGPIARGLSLGQFERAVRSGVRSLDDYRAFLREAHYAPADVATLVSTLEQLLVEELAARARRDQVDAGDAARDLTRRELERAVVAGLRSIEEYEQLLARAGYATDDAVTLMDLLRGEAEAAAAAHARRDQVADALAPRDVPIATYERAAKLNLITPAQYRAVLARAGYSEDDQALLTDVLLAELQALRRAEDRRGAIARELEARQLSLGQKERLVRTGIETLDDYRAFVLGAGFSADDADLLVRLLNEQLLAKKDGEARRAKIAEQLVAKGVDLDALEAAVLAGELLVDDYTRTLAGAGVKAEDVGLLVGLLVPQLEAAAA